MRPRPIRAGAVIPCGPASSGLRHGVRRERAREKEVLKRRLAALIAEEESVAQAVDAEVARINGTPDDPRSFDDLDRLLVDQVYRLAYWRVATEEINYRRFFEINDLAAIRMECDAVFDDMHQLLRELVAQGRLQGVRLDHVGTDQATERAALAGNAARDRALAARPGVLRMNVLAFPDSASYGEALGKSGKTAEAIAEYVRLEADLQEPRGRRARAPARRDVIT